MNIHFICRGNVLRSLVAETYVRSLELRDIECISSGVCVDLDDPIEREYFQNTIALLKRHGISRYAKKISHQLTQERVNSADVTICANQRTYNEASGIVMLPSDTIIWNIVDIGEGARAAGKDILNIRMSYEEEIYDEIKMLADELIS